VSGLTFRQSGANLKCLPKYLLSATVKRLYQPMGVFVGVIGERSYGEGHSPFIFLSVGGLPSDLLAPAHSFCERVRRGSLCDLFVFSCPFL
jgi:hypothetical protein